MEGYLNTCILIIDDDEEDHFLMRESIEEVGLKISIVTALDGKLALQLLERMKENLPCLVILDYNMPGMNGIQVLEKIKELYNIPVLIHTTSCTEELVREARGKGALDCIAKCTSNADIINIGKTIERFLTLQRSHVFLESRIKF